MSGINDQMRELITTNVIERNHPGALAQVWRSGADRAGSYYSGLLTDGHRRVWSALN
jgi:hypothetical protein